MVIGQNCQPRAACEAIVGHPSPHGLGHLTDFRVGVAFEVVVPLKFKSGVIWPPRRARNEAVVKSWHRVVGKIYLKSAGSVVCWWSNFWNLGALEFARVWQNHLEDGFSLVPRTTSNQTSVCARLSDVLHRSFGAFMASKYARL